ncbi:MAG: flavin reductase family protein [Candidatus Omnitrophica bacterium]|nr:flavin reductase family protein [Candidatus Omnitrophota bacterium]
MRKKVPLDIAYRIIQPGPTVLVSSLYNERCAITPIAWHMPVSDDPPIIALEIYHGHFIYKAVMQTGDFVVNVPPSEMAETVRKLGSVSGAKVDKFTELGLVREKSEKVSSPRLGGAIAILECKLRNEKAIAKKYDLILADVVYAEAEESVFTDRWMPENPGPRILHHLGGKIFYVPSNEIITKK